MSCIYLYIVCYIPRVQHPVFWWFSMIFHFENPYMLINDRISMVMRFHRGVLESMCPWFQRPLEITISQSFRKEGIPKWAMTKTLVVLGVHGGWQASQLYGDYIFIYIYIVQVANLALRFFLFAVKFPSTTGRAGPIFQFFFRHTFWSTPWDPLHP